MSRVVRVRNAHKIEEMVRPTTPACNVEGGRHDAFDGVGTRPRSPETEATFEGNALLKARVDATAPPAYPGGGRTTAGLCVDALNGMDGIPSARWSGGGETRANVELVRAARRHPGRAAWRAVPLRRRLVLPDGARPVHGEMRSVCPCARAARTASATTRSSCPTARRGPAPSSRATRRTRSATAETPSGPSSRSPGAPARRRVTRACLRTGPVRPQRCASQTPVPRIVSTSRDLAEIDVCSAMNPPGSWCHTDDDHVVTGQRTVVDRTGRS